MSAKHPTLNQLMREAGYLSGGAALKDPRVVRFIAKQSGKRFRRIQQLYRKQKARQQPR